ncbi:MAG: HipA domain-containing protein [Proteobacteria bacterium]|nr:HipA domain-containing protein [Pseudomonadota bacterium]
MTRYCPITYDLLEDNALYSNKGLHQLSPKLRNLEILPYSTQEQRKEAAARATKLSIQGAQSKLSAILDLRQQTFVFVDKGGRYILKPESDTWPELPANEAISMTLAERFDIEVPVHGLVHTKDDGLTYFIKRFDRTNHSLVVSREANSRENNTRESHSRTSQTREASSREARFRDSDTYKGNAYIHDELYWPSNKLAVEDFAQLSNKDRETKYNSSVEEVIKIIDKFSTFPRVEYIKLLRRILFNFVIGNEDMHLKNYSLINQNNKWQLAPAYDFLNTTIAIGNPSEESALPINGRKNKLTKQDFIDYLATERLGLTVKIINSVMAELEALKPIFIELIGRSYLTSPMKEAYISLVKGRYDRLF